MVEPVLAVLWFSSLGCALGLSLSGEFKMTIAPVVIFIATSIAIEFVGA